MSSNKSIIDFTRIVKRQIFYESIGSSLNYTPCLVRVLPDISCFHRVIRIYISRKMMRLLRVLSYTRIRGNEEDYDSTLLGTQPIQLKIQTPGRCRS